METVERPVSVFSHDVVMREHSWSVTPLRTSTSINQISLFSSVIESIYISLLEVMEWSEGMTLPTDLARLSILKCEREEFTLRS